MFPWDGSNLGDITDNVVSYISNDTGNFIILKDGTASRIHMFENSIPLIADELKILFGITKIGRHRAIYKNKDFLLSKIEGIECNFVYVEGVQIEDIQKTFIFRTCLGLTARGEYPLYIRQYKSGIISVTSFLDTNISYEEYKILGSKLSCNMITKWFGSPSKINLLINKMFTINDLFPLRCKIEQIIKRIDNSYCWWTMAIIGRIQSKID